MGGRETSFPTRPSMVCSPMCVFSPVSDRIRVSSILPNSVALRYQLSVLSCAVFSSSAMLASSDESSVLPLLLLPLLLRLLLLLLLTLCSLQSGCEVGGGRSFSDELIKTYYVPAS